MVTGSEMKMTSGVMEEAKCWSAVGRPSEFLVLGRELDVACLAFALVFFLSEKVVKCTSKEIPDGWGLARAYAEELKDSFLYDGMRREGRKLEKGVAKTGVRTKVLAGREVEVEGEGQCLGIVW
ncbi:hypothetical protein MRB53_026053 [Persea americana]|uniref:Uncharacterized protein n=1 Tax=Persea americana TaxID=3435 RepID=A0ACC2LI05_PERAE|nr:hypothetical protein MRB53_026053 [Persea americana]